MLQCSPKITDQRVKNTNYKYVHHILTENNIVKYERSIFILIHTKRFHFAAKTLEEKRRKAKDHESKQLTDGNYFVLF